MGYVEIIKKIKGSIAFIAVLNSQNEPIGTGTGFVFWKNGILVTCNHVVKGVGAIFIKFNGGEFRSAKVVIKDEEHDLALLKFEGKEEPLAISEIEDIQEGTEVLFAGYPLSLQDLTTHQGIISAITKDLSGITIYLIDGTVNAGNSGCPLLDLDGKVLGVVNAKRMEQSNLLSKVKNMKTGAVALHGVDLVDIYGAIISNLQLGIGHAVPAKYIPDHKEITDNKQTEADIKKMNSLEKKL